MRCRRHRRSASRTCSQRSRRRLSQPCSVQYPHSPGLPRPTGRLRWSSRRRAGGTLPGVGHAFHPRWQPTGALGHPSTRSRAAGASLSAGRGGRRRGRGLPHHTGTRCLMAGDKTEKATPKKRDEARKKGQVAQVARPQRRGRDARRALRARRRRRRMLPTAGRRDAPVARAGRRPRASSRREPDRRADARTWAPRCSGGRRRSPSPACVAGVVANVAQVGFKPSPAGAEARPQEAQPDLRRRRTSSARTPPSRPSSRSPKVGIVGADRRVAVCPEAHGDRRDRRHARRASCAAGAGRDILRHRAARRRGLPR